MIKKPTVILIIVATVIVLLVGIFAGIQFANMMNDSDNSDSKTDSAAKSSPVGTSDTADVSEETQNSTESTEETDNDGGRIYSVIEFEADKDNPTDEEMNAVVAMMRTRLDGMGYTEAFVSRLGKKHIRIEIPDIEDPYEITNTLGSTAQLQFLDAEENVVLTGNDIKNASAKYEAVDEMGTMQHFVEIELTAEGKEKFADATARIAELPYGQNVIYIMMDNAIISAPSVVEAINADSCIIQGDFDAETTKVLAAQIRSGQLPFSLLKAAVYNHKMPF